jgi:DNA polymerase-4
MSLRVDSGGDVLRETGTAYPKRGRVILHIDMNAFYCSVHEAAEPDKYRGKPLAVAGSAEARKGIVVTSSYTARARGVRTGLTVREALKLCPGLILLKPDFDLYRSYSLAFLRITGEYSPLVEPVSIDECYVDITGSKAFGTPLAIAEEVQRRVREELGLPCSIGVAPNKLLAKTASDMKKPNGLTVLRLRDVEKTLWPLPCGTLHGIGVKTAAKLERLGIRTLGALAEAEEAFLVTHFGTQGHWLKRAANGLDESPVSAEREQAKSVGHTVTLPADVTEKGEVHRVLLNLADQVTRRLRRKALIAATVQITIRRPDMKTITRAVTLPYPTDEAAAVYHAACGLYDKHWPVRSPVRLFGIACQNLREKAEVPMQLDLFDYREQPKRAELTSVMDRIRDKFGEDAILTAGMLGDDPSARIRNKKERGTSLQMDHLERNHNE